MTDTAVGGPLSQTQIDEYNEQGFILLPCLFSEEEVKLMSREADRILALAINTEIATGEKDVRLDVMTCTEDNSLLDVRKLQPVKDMSEFFQSLTEDERLLGPLRQIMTQEPVLMEEKLNYKQKIRCAEYQAIFNPPATEDRFWLHHDWGYFRREGYPCNIISSAIAIDECTIDNGPLRMIPGSHKSEWPMLNPDPMSGDGRVVESIFSEDERVPILCPAGSVMVFHAMLLHDSVPNATRQPRRLMIYSHYPGDHIFPEDERNKRNREQGQALESRYMDMLKRGEFKDVFSLNTR